MRNPPTAYLSRNAVAVYRRMQAMGAALRARQLARQIEYRRMVRRFCRRSAVMVASALVCVAAGCLGWNTVMVVAGLLSLGSLAALCRLGR